jgi:pimeloyl-ACP methyl ester carboxylesterase
MTGDGDAGSPPHMSEAMAKAIPRSEIHTLDRQQHMMPVLDAVRVNERLRAFVEKATER